MGTVLFRGSSPGPVEDPGVDTPTGLGYPRFFRTVVPVLIRNFRRVARDVPALAGQARDSLDNLDGGVRRANVTMAILAGVAIVALGVATFALLQARSNSVREIAGRL